MPIDGDSRGAPMSPSRRAEYIFFFPRPPPAFLFRLDDKRRSVLLETRMICYRLIRA